MNNKHQCQECEQEKIIYKYGLCQKCYKKVLNEYHYNYLKQEYVGKKIPKKYRPIINLALLNLFTGTHISKLLEINVRSVNWAIKKYTYKGNKDGLPKPKFNK